MPTTVVPLKVKIGLRPNGHADHPDWHKLPMVAVMSREAGEDVIRSHNAFLGGWKYDKTSGHADDTTDSPMGQQWGMLFVSEQFSAEAEAHAEIGPLVERMTEAEAIDFWDNKAHAHLDEFRRDTELLNGLKVELDLLEAVGGQAARITGLKAKIKKAIDPDDPEPGLKRNMEKRWALKSPTSGVVLKGRTP